MRRLACVLLVCAWAHAQDDAAMAHAREAYDAWQAAKGKPKPKLPKDASHADRIFAKSGPTVADVNRGTFWTRFAKTSFEKWDAENDADLVRAGLRLTARHGHDRGLAAAGLKAAKLFLARYPDDDDAPLIQGHDIPLSLFALGRVEEAAKTARPVAPSLQGVPGVRVWLMLADLAAVGGNYKQARKHLWEARDRTVEKDVKLEDIESYAELQREAANLVLRAQIKLRQRHLGQPLPALKRTGAAGPVSKMLATKPGPIALWFFSPSYEEDLRMLAELDELAPRLVGVTWFETLKEDKGERWLFLPKDRTFLTDGSAAVTPSSLRIHLFKVRKPLKLKGALAIVKAEHAKEWVPRTMRTLLVVTDAQRRVAIVTAADDRGRALHLVRALVK